MSNGIDELVDMDSKEGLAVKRGKPKRKKFFLSLLLALVLLLVFTCLAGLGYNYYLRFSGPVELSAPPPQEQYRAWLKEIDFRLQDEKIRQQRLVSLIDEKMRAYNILRNVKGEPEDSEICARLVREKIVLQESLDWLNGDIASLSELYRQLKNVVLEIDNGDIAKVSRESPQLVFNVRAALEIKQPEKSSGLLDLTGDKPAVSPDEQMKFKE